MRPLKIDFRPRFPWRAAALWAGVAILMMVAACLGWATWQVRAEAAQLSRANAELEVNIALLKARRQAELVPPRYAEAISELVAIAQFPLDAALGVLERIDVPGARIASIDINALEGTGSVVVEASSAESLQLFLEGLAAQQSRPRWELQSVSSVKKKSGDLQITGSEASTSGNFDLGGHSLSYRAQINFR
ncbi:hypothetical protein [Roseateles sp.]|uniref:hypothetical protein n=1 Tax=Roseateles sp. TaxID=1971397 RepID=UPI0039EC35D1